MERTSKLSNLCFGKLRFLSARRNYFCRVVYMCCFGAPVHLAPCCLDFEGTKKELGHCSLVHIGFRFQEVVLPKL